MKEFFEDFFKRYEKQILFFSFWRIVAFAQFLFWPYAFSKIVNIMSQNPENWQEACFWAMLMILNNLSDDFIRLRSKFGLEMIGAKLQISLATFFSKNTKLRRHKKTGEGVQAIKKASDDIRSLANYYKDDLLQLPVNFIIIPLILSTVNPHYVFILIVYGILYLAIDFLTIRIFYKRLKKYFMATEIFWGTAYRKVPDVWRQREDGETFAQEIEREGRDLYRATVSSENTGYWRWIFLQALSSASVGVAVVFALSKIIQGTAPVGDLILVTAYFDKTQETLNIITETVTRVIQTKLSFKRLEQAVEII